MDVNNYTYLHMNHDFLRIILMFFRELILIFFVYFTQYMYIPLNFLQRMQDFAFCFITCTFMFDEFKF